MSEKNEFENLDLEDNNIPNDFSDTPTTAPAGEADGGQVSSGPMGTKYDWSNAPDTTRAPPRVDLNGKTVTIKSADIILPDKGVEWSLSRNGKTKYKYCTFTLKYSEEAQQENYSGVRVFERDGGMYSHPTMTRDRNNQASTLLGLYADFRKKDINEVSLKEFMGFLNGQPQAILKGVPVKNPTSGESITKNIVEKFVA